VPLVDLAGEGFLVLPLQVGGEVGGALVLHVLAAPARLFGGGRALALVAEIVGQALTVAQARASAQRLCAALESELGVSRRALSAREESLRSQEENIHELTRSLIRSNRVKREFLGTVSHELRTPLNAILGYTALVREGMAGPLAEEQASLLDRVLNNTHGLNQLIDDMLFFVQLEADRVVVRHERVAVRELIDETVASIPEQPGRERVALAVQVAPAAAVLHVDPELLRRVLFHLVGNAFKFTARGEVSVEVRAGAELGAAVVAVRDTGVGIAPERLADVFELFAQGDSSTTRRYDGLGMGLTLVQRCVRLLRGELAVESRPGLGSEFRVHLPGALLVPADDAPDASADTLH
jgi:signal transduction histidine kinase